MRHFERVSADGVVIDRAVVLEPGDSPEDLERSPVKKVLGGDQFYAMEMGETIAGRNNTTIRRVD